ncbi:MAG: DNA mismatch repair endonuclease MutL [Phycisphaerae bacterium]|nr:DNA mismatch repair endonuclease MutL [Phycisphaerae bacterium]
MPSIQVLPDLLVNKIAAGEVVERPASVVKELVENSLDSGAHHIEIAIEEGGRRLTRVVDDGSGMDAEDLARCVLPHATSKIRGESDLFAIRTMGFRGEALPSIGSVSQLRIVSRRADTHEAHEIRMAGDQVEPIIAASGPPGTTVEVRELFFNVPARQKFLRTAQTEMGHITEQVARIALVHPGIEFRLTHNGRLIHHLRPADHVRSRVADLYGAELADSLLEFTRDERGLNIRGYAGRPADSRSSGKWQYIFLNGRYIHDRFVSAAAREAYRGLMEANRYPVFFIALQVDPAAVDVNVHPTKSEVRWQDSNVVYSQVLSVLRDRFLNANLTTQYRPNPGGRPAPAPFAAPATGLRALSPDPTDSMTQDELDADRRREVRQSVAEFYKRSLPAGHLPPPGGPASAGASGEPGCDWSRRSPMVRTSWPSTPAEYSAATTAGDRETGSTAAEPQLASPHPPVWSAPAGGSSPAGRAPRVIQVHRAFLVTESDDGLTIIDQHALHERILYEKISEQIRRGSLESQRLLLPETVNVAPDHVALIESHGQLFGQLGFELSPYGPSTIAVHAAPSLLSPERVADFVRDALDRLVARDAPASGEMLMNDLIAMCACKAAVKAGDPLSPAEIESLMAQRHLVDRSTNCPHGRPTSLNLALSDLEKQFKRT